MDAPAIFIIIGITGDLAKRKLLPALAHMLAAGVLPTRFKIIGITRRQGVTPSSILEEISAAESLHPYLEIYSMSLADAADYMRLKTYLVAIETELGETSQRLWHLAVPPETSHPIIEHLGLSGLSRIPNTKLLIEKPFGTDGRSAQKLSAHIAHSFTSAQVYRIDHYLAKEEVRSSIAFRRDNPLFEKTWNRTAVERIAILASEEIGIEGRAIFYEQTGALRDVVQSHLLELTALMLMTLPENESRHIPEARCALLETLQVLPASIRRGQYAGYREEVGNPSSAVETFVSLSLFSTDPRWQGVPITLVTGKALSKKETAVVAGYRRGTTLGENPFPLRIQSGDGYERVFLEALLSNHDFFVSSNEIRESWRIIDAVRSTWASDSDDLIFYPQGATPEHMIGH